MKIYRIQNDQFEEEKNWGAYTIRFQVLLHKLVIKMWWYWWKDIYTDQLNGTKRQKIEPYVE